jgi:hypothetical protein
MTVVMASTEKQIGFILAEDFYIVSNQNSMQPKQDCD